MNALPDQGERPLPPVDTDGPHGPPIGPSCRSCGGNDGYGPPPHHAPDCYFASAEDSAASHEERAHCPNCEGRGFVWQEGEVTCPACKGTTYDASLGESAS